MVVDIGGAALGAAMGLLLTALKDVTEKNVMFKPSLLSLTATLEILKPLMDEVKKLDKELKRWDEVLTQRQQESAYYESQIKEGEKHVRKCSEVCCCNIFKKSYYKDKLLELDRTLKSLIVAGLLARDSKETLISVRKILDLLKAFSDSSASVSNDILNFLREISARIKGDRDVNSVECADQVIHINSVEPADHVISMFSSHTPHPPLNIEQEIEPVLPPPPPSPPNKPSPPSPSPPPPLTKPSPPPPPPPTHPSLTESPPTAPFTHNYGTESHNYKFQVESAGGTTVRMKPVIDKVTATLGVLVPLISQIEKFHTELALPNGHKITDLKSEMEEAEKLIQKCSNVSRFNLLKKKHYTDMLLGLDETLFRWVQTLQIQLASDVKKSLVVVRELHAHIVEHGGINDVGLNQILSRVSSINVTSSSPTGPPGGFMREEPPSTKVLSG